MSAAASHSPPSRNANTPATSSGPFAPPPPPQPLPPPPPPPMTTSTPTQQAPLPQPQTFDILQPLHVLLSRLEPSLNVYTPDPLLSDPAMSSALSGLSAQSSTAAASSSNSLTQIASNQSQGQPPSQLAYKDVVTAAQFLKARMRKALAELGKLGDMDRDVEQQEEEMRLLEHRIKGQKAVLAVLAEQAAAASATISPP